MAIAASDLIGDLIAQSPTGRVLESKFKGLADIALGEAKRGGCTYADVRFTRNANSGVNATGGNRDAADLGGFGGAAARRAARRRGRTRAGPAAAARGARAAATPPRAAGFGVRVIHSGVWGFASSPIVTEDEIRRITRIAAEVAKASAIAKKADVKLAPVPAYTGLLGVADEEGSVDDRAGGEAGVRAEGRRQGGAEQGRHERQRLGAARGRVEVLRVERRLLHRAGDLHDDAEVQRHGAQGRRDRARATTPACR